MAAGIEQYQDLIEQLKPVVKEPAFNQILSQVASSVPRPKRFLIKMELKRQAKPCKRIIDLRGMVDGQCRPYEHDGILHYLDDTAQEVFERQVRSFGGYTLGVYEAVTNTENNFRVMHQKSQQDNAETPGINQDLPPESRYQTPLISFSGFHQRREERMNFVVPVDLFTELRESVHANSVDISVSGLKVKVHKRHMFKPGEKLTVHFRGLELDYGLRRGEGVQYLLTDIDRSREEQRLSLKRLYEQDQKGFDTFLERFIQGNKRRYKVNMDNTIDAIMTKGFEQYYIPHFTSVPVFVGRELGELHPRYLLSNDCNREVIQYWRDEVNDLQLGYLFTRNRLEAWAARPAGQQETYLFTFTHVTQGRVYFYTASMDELDANKGLKGAFLSYGSRKASWRVYKAQLCDMLPEQCHTPLSLPDSVNEQIKRQNQPPSARLLSRLKGLQHIVLLTDVTSEWTIQAYQKRKFSKQQLAGLQVFCHPRNKRPPEILPYRFKYQELRRETRFLLRTPVELTHAQFDLGGVTEDFSPSGLRIELQNLFPLDVGAEVELSFPKLQQLTNKYELAKLPYKVVRVSDDRNVLHLRQSEEEKDTVARSFFVELIRNNRRSLKPTHEQEDLAGIGEALRNIYAANVQNIALFIKKVGVQFQPDSITEPPLHHPLLPLLKHLAEPEQLNLYPLFAARLDGREFIEQTLKNLRTHNKPHSFELFVAFNPQARSIQQATIVRLAQQFNSDAQRREFISVAMGKGQFFAIRLFLTRTGRPDISLLHSELSYVGAYAVHKAKMLEEQLWNVAAVADIVDVTAEAMYRYGFNQHHIEANARAGDKG
ncbi:PilZ domain-containing protein [Bowmanella dokdonensis]|uniref:PilZ domain-containing protein n=1 Tax=Bowmanella dokdonensis TaxID=751969 RepID=A0A939ITI0_9ALTE|nr:PilZ domain-containing protein [Bowmanella dokdonensis]MBN7827476.1 PilZ domain-containing protein [Bowmanella dokdonensis]